MKNLVKHFSGNIDKNKHAFFSRNGGISGGKYSSLNMNFHSNDVPENIAKNYQIISESFGLTIDKITTVNQGFSSDVFLAKSGGAHNVKADAIITKTRGILLCVKTADCLPILITDYTDEIVAIVHGGWRSVANGIVENTICEMIKNGAKIENISVALGPCIRQKSFEVGSDVFNTFNNAEFFQSVPNKSEKYMFDLVGLVDQKIRIIGVKNIFDCGLDTYSDKENFFSFRRDTHNGIIGKNPKDFATQISCIML